MRGRSRTQTIDASLLSLYRRGDAYWLIASVQTTVGLWMVAPDQAASTVPLDADEEVLGAALLQLASLPTPVVEHPRQEEWKAQLDASLRPLMQQARVRSWRAFESGARQVSVVRTGRRYDLTPLLPDVPKPGAWTDDTDRRLSLNEPDVTTLGEVAFSLL